MEIMMEYLVRGSGATDSGVEKATKKHLLEKC